MGKKIIERVVEAPATMLEATVQRSTKVAYSVPTGHPIRRSREYWHTLGPGLTTGASDDDPSGIATYSQTGAQYGFQLLWLAPITFPLMAVVQEMCARIGLVTGRGLAGNIKTHFSKRVLYICTTLLFIANTFNIGADLGAMAKAFQLLYGGIGFGPLVIGFATLTLLLLIYTPYARYAKYLKWLALVLFAYVISAILAHLNWGDVTRHTITPSLQFSKDQIILVCAILGTTISPYLFFWQTSQEIEQEVVDGKTTIASRRGTDKKAVNSMRVDVWSGMFLSNIAMFFIIAACGAILFPKGITHINTAADAAEALRPFAGNLTYWLFSIGVLGVGLLSIPVLASSSSYAISESLGWKQGLYRNLHQAKAFYGVMMFSVLIGLGINFIGLNPIKALIYAAVLNGVVAPVILTCIVILSCNKHIMGEWVSKRLTKAVGWAATAVMAVAGIAAIYSLF